MPGLGFKPWLNYCARSTVNRMSVVGGRLDWVDFKFLSNLCRGDRVQWLGLPGVNPSLTLTKFVTLSKSTDLSKSKFP